MLEGKNVNLRLAEQEDMDFLVECRNNLVYSEYDSVTQVSRTERMREFNNPSQLETSLETTRFVIEKKDKTKIGRIAHWFVLPNKYMEIGYLVIPKERNKKYGIEAVQIILDYLFLSRPLCRIQAMTDTRNLPSQKVLEKSGFKQEGIVRRSAFVRGEWVDACLYGILREEWKEPKILTKTT